MKELRYILGYILTSALDVTFLHGYLWHIVYRILKSRRKFIGKIKIVILKNSNYFANIKDRNKRKGVIDIICVLKARVSSIWLR